MGILTEKHSIGNTIAELRKAKGWTQLELAEKLQVSDKAVSKWEKDNGSPSIEFFPVLAELFDVSIDYLMTGKVAEKDIIIMSKLELCAKNDDVKMFNSIPENVLMNKDENQKDIIHYIGLYDSKNIFNALLNKYGVKSLTRNYCDNDFFKFNDKEVIKLLIKFELFEELNKIEFFNFNAKPKYYNCPQYYVGSFIDYILKELNIKSNFIKFITNLYLEDNSKSNWINLYSNILKFALETDNKEYIESFLLLIIKINNDAINNVTPSQLTQIFNSTGYNVIENIVKVDSSTIKLLLNKGYLEEAKFLYTYCLISNKEKLNDGEFEMHSKKQLGTISDYEKIVLPCVHNNIVDLDKLLPCNNYTVIKKALSEYYIHPTEYICLCYNNKDFRKLYELAVDNNLLNLASYILMKDFANYNSFIIKEIIKICNESIFQKWDLLYGKAYNRKYFKMDGFSPRFKTINDIYGKCQQIKNELLLEVKSKFDKEKILEELSIEYFNEQIKKENIELIIIKLCVRLEAVLKGILGYDGTFEEMLTHYCNEKCDVLTADLLNKLRKQRNKIVHAETNIDNIDMNDIKECINYICKL